MVGKGMSLIEVLVYSVLSLLILTLVSAYMFSVYRSAHRCALTNNNALTLCIALTTLARDIKRNSLMTVKAKDRTYCIITDGSTDLGWVAKDKRLMRYTGIYNCVTKKWSSVASSQLVNALDRVRFMVTDDDITCRLTKGSCTCELVMRIP